VAVENNQPGTAVSAGAGESQTESASLAHGQVSELVSERPAAPSPFGDDQTFPLPVDRLNFIPPTPV
jgi:hypothetical protein